MSPIKTALRATLAAALLLTTAAAASAEGALCRGELSDIIVEGGLLVPEGASCRLRHVTIRGNLIARPGSALRIGDDVAILGNLAIEGCAFASLQPSRPEGAITIGGDAEIAHCREASGKLFTAGDVSIAGNFVCRDNAAPCFAVSLTVLGNVLVLSNSGGVSYVESDTIAGNLECRGNAGVGDYGQANRVAGRKLGQCAGLSDWPPID